MAYGRRARFEALRTLAFGGIGAAYAACGGATTDYTRIVSFFNGTDVDVTVSLDGVTDHLRVSSGSGQVFDLTANEVKDDGLFIPVGTTFYLKQSVGAPSKGSFWIQVMNATGGV